MLAGVLARAGLAVLKAVLGWLPFIAAYVAGKRAAHAAALEIAVAHAIEILREAFEDHGSVEGLLQVASERGSFHVTVYEPLWDQPIRCSVTPERLQECLRLFGQRVEVFGLVRYRNDGTPISIEAEEIVPFPQVEGLPSPDDVRGILRNYS